MSARPEAVEWRGKLYRHDAFQAFMHEEALAELGQRVPDGSSPRRAIRAVRSMKTPATHAAVMMRTLERLAKTHELDRQNVIVVASFPANFIETGNR